MSSLTTCLRKAGKFIHAEDKAAIVERASALRGEGVDAQEAARRAVQEQLGKVRQMLDAAAPVVHAAAPADPTKADGVTRAVAGGQLGVNGQWYEGGQILPSSEDTIKGEQTRPSGTRSDAAPTVAVDTSVPTTPAGTLAGSGLVVEQKTSQRGKTYWSVTGNTREHEALLDQLGFGKPFKMGGKWYRSVFDADPTERLAAALQGNLPPAPAVERPSLSAEDAAPILRQFKVEVARSGDGWIVTGKTFDIKDTIKDTGGRWNGQAWAYSQDPTGILAAALKERGSPGASVDDAGTGDTVAEIERRRELRQREDARNDERADAGDVAQLVGDDTKALIRRGAQFNIPASVLNDQIEDVGLILNAHAKGKTLFLLANEAGTGKTMVLGGAIRELRKRGESKFVYVTMNTDLIAQIKRDLADYGVSDVKFHTYSELSSKGFDTAGAILIFDEAHNVKNVGAETARANAAQEQMAAAKMTLLASATLFENPVEARYLAATGVFDPVGGFNEWAKMYGAAVKVRKFYNPNTGRQQTEEIIYWPGRGKKEDGAAARAWLFKQAVMTQRAMKIDPGMVDVQFRRAPVEQKWVDLYQQVSDAYDAAEDAWKDENGNPRDAKIVSEIARHRENTIKRILEASKIPFAIEEAKKLLASGRNVVVFVETKADRTLGMWKRSEHFKDDTLYSYDQMQQMLHEWQLEANMARQMDERAPPRPFAEFIVEIARFFHAAGIHAELPSTSDEIEAAIGKDRVAIYTGAVSNTVASKNKADFMAGRKTLLVATMAKGGTGLSLHDTKGNRPTTQLNINLPWKATGVDQVSARVARYGLASKAEVRWLFASNIPWESNKLAPRVGARMRDMGAIVKGLEVKAAEVLDGNFDFEGDIDVKGGAAIAPAAEGDIYERAKRMEALRRKADDTSHGFFETPYPLAALMTNIGGVRAGQRLLEPSAGRGNLLRLLPDGVNTTAVELRQDNRDALARLKPDAQIVPGDFMQFTGGPFDTVLMNPPFERVAEVGAQDVAHVMRAYDMLDDGGRLVAIMGEGAFFREFKQEAAFRQWLDDVGATVIQLPEGAFKQSGTGVRTRMVVIDKGGESGRTDLDLHDMEPDTLRAVERQIPSRASVALAESKLPDATMPAEPRSQAETDQLSEPTTELAATNLSDQTIDKPTAAAIVQEAETLPPAPADETVIDVPAESDAQESAAAEKIADFGQKIGGARKDTAKPIGKRMKAEVDERPGWARKYTAMPVRANEGNAVSLLSIIGKDPVTPYTPGAKWALFTGQPPFMSRVGRMEWNTEQEALDFIPLAEVGRKHRVYPYKDGDATKFGIFRKMGERKRALVKGDFASEKDAMVAMVADPVSIIEHRFPFPERPWLDNVERIGPPRHTGNVTPTMFQQTFGFRGGEFGKWNMGGDGQAVLNHAYDALLDLADVLGVPPKALSLNGELAIAFGARGHGGKGFKEAGAAHYETDYEVMNLTKEQGAGSLAHEWFHALDHYLARLDNAASREFTTNERGDRVRVTATGRGDNMLTAVRARRSEARSELVSALRAVVDATQGVPKQVPVNPKAVKKRLDDAKSSVEYRLRDLRGSLTDGQYNRSKKTASQEQLAKWDALAERVRAGDLGERIYIGPQGELAPDTPASRFGRISTARESTRVIVDMNAIYKAVTGRSFDKSGYDSTGARLKADAEYVGKAREALTTAERRAAAGETDTVTRTSEFYANARDIDAQRVSPYWSTPHEMAARAFEAYIMDRIAERAGRSDYLVYGAENRYYALFGMKPYPEGDERRAINSAFDRLFQTIQTKADDAGNVAMFKRPMAELADPAVYYTAQHAERVQSVAETVAQTWAAPPDVVVVRDLQDPQVPDRVRQTDAAQRSMGANGTPFGFYLGGKVYLVASQLRTDRDIIDTLFHESLGHAGLRAAYGKALTPLLRQLASANVQMVEAKGKAYGLGSMVDGKWQWRDDFARVQAAEEVLAEMAQTRPTSTWVQKAIAAIRSWLREHVPGFKDMAYSDAELIRTFIAPARDAIERGQQTEAQQAEAMFSRSTVAQGRIRRTIDELVSLAEQQSNWRDWYDRHKAVVESMFGADVNLFQQILSATSQLQTVKGNVTMALRAYEMMITGRPFEGFLPQVARNLDRIRQGANLGGQKIREFEKANLGDEQAMAVDRHIARLLFNTDRPSRAQVEAAKVRIRKVADRLGWTYRETQAALWAANQVLQGTDPGKVVSYDQVLESRADLIDAIHARNGRAGERGVPAGRAVAAGVDEAGFSRGRADIRGVAPADARAVVAAVREALPTAPPIHLLESVEQAPSELRDQIREAGASNDVEAAYHNGEIYVFPGHMESVDRMAFVVGHHEIRHHGLRSILGPRIGQVMLSMWQSNPGLKAEAQKIIDAGHATSRVQAIEEALADMPVDRLTALSGWDKIVAAVRQWARDLAVALRRTMPRLADAIDPAQWTDRDIAAMVSRAEDVSRGGSQLFRTTGTAFNREDNPTWYSALGRQVEGASMNAGPEKVSISSPNDIAYRTEPNGIAKGSNAGKVLLVANDSGTVDRYWTGGDGWTKNKALAQHVTPAEAQAQIDKLRRAGEQLGFDITPAMRDHAAGGMPMFSRQTNHTPEQAEALAKAGIRKPASVMERVRASVGRALDTVRDPQELWDTFRQGNLDQFWGIARAVQRDATGLADVNTNPYVAARLANGATSSVMRALLLHGQARWAENMQHMEKIPGTHGLLDILAPLGEDVHDWFGWMIGNRAERLMKEGRENNFTAADIKALISLGTPEKLAAFRKAATEFAAFKRSVLDLAEKAGVINPEARLAWDYSDWIPFYRKLDETTAGVAGGQVRGIAAKGKKGLAGQSSGIRRLKGGDAALNDPIENILMNFSRLIDASLKNNAIRKTVLALEEAGSDAVTRVGYQMASHIIPASEVKRRLIEAGTPEDVLDTIPEEAFNGMAKMWAIQAPADPDVVRVMIDGKPTFWRVGDRILLRALTSFVPFDFPGLAIARAAKRLLTSMVTSTPDFMLRNWIRDTLSVQAISRDAINPVESVKGLWKSYSESGAAEEMLFAGASFGSGQVNAADPEGTAAEVRRALRAKGMNASTRGVGSVILDTPAKLYDQWRRISEATENANRESIYAAAEKRGATAAAFEAKDALDFSLRGSSAAYQLLADVLPFFNARVQGLYRLGRADPKRILTVGTLIAVASLLLAAANNGQDWYEELPDYDKDTYWHFKIKGQHFRIPKPFEIGVAFATVPERIMRRILNLDTTKKMLVRLYSNVRDQLAFDPTPQVVKPLYDVLMNWDSFRSMPIESDRDKGRLAPERAGGRTSSTMQHLSSDVLDPLSKPFQKIGADEAFGLSPKRLEYLWDGYLGTAGAYALGLSDMVVNRLDRKPTGPTLRPDDLPIVRSFYRVDPARATVYESDLYRIREEVEKVYQSVKATRQDRPERAAQLEQREAPLLSARRLIEHGASNLGKLNRQIDEVYKNPTMSAAEKRQRVDELQRQKNATAKQVVTSPGLADLR